MLSCFASAMPTAAEGRAVEFIGRNTDAEFRREIVTTVGCKNRRTAEVQAWDLGKVY